RSSNLSMARTRVLSANAGSPSSWATPGWARSASRSDARAAKLGVASRARSTPLPCALVAAVAALDCEGGSMSCRRSAPAMPVNPMEAAKAAMASRRVFIPPILRRGEGPQPLRPLRRNYALNYIRSKSLDGDTRDDLRREAGCHQRVEERAVHPHRDAAVLH